METITVKQILSTKVTLLNKENERYQGNISCKDGLDKGQKWYGPNRGRRRSEEHTSELQ